MQGYGVNELRKMFLDYFESKGHTVLKSFSLVPRNDKSLLLINSGMAPMKAYFTGQEIPPNTRVATCQKCIRTGDIENVGKTARHGTFFEMLGNFSFGDYFKKEAIHWSWEFLTEVVGLEASRLYPSVYLEDDEAFQIWNEEIGIAKERIFKFGKADNFWEHGAGPCGPCSEIYYDRGEKYGCDDPGCTVGCECDRYIEVWNNVFTQFNSDGEGNYTELEKKNIDTGMGLERLGVVVQDVASIFDVDTVKAVREAVCELAHLKYQEDAKKDISIRLITDHIRSATFMISDGVTPSNEGRGYVLRKLIRRAVRHGRLLGIEGQFMKELSQVVIDGAKDGYPELEEKSAFIHTALSAEEKQFNKTIDNGLNILEKYIEELVAQKKNTLSGEAAFKLYDTYGFPVDLTSEIMEEKGYDIDLDGFKEYMQAQRKSSRESRATYDYTGESGSVYNDLPVELSSEFTGYDSFEGYGKIKAMTLNDENNQPVDIVKILSEGQRGSIILDKTPFYGMKGGQAGDIGRVSSPQGCFFVEDSIWLKGEKLALVGFMDNGTFEVEEEVLSSVDVENRRATMRNHSATHLLQKSLKMVLGDHVEQKGSMVDPKLLRFDFSHFNALTKEEIAKLEDLVNQSIREALPVEAKIMPIDQAKASGAMSLFDEKYGDEVRVISMGGFSKELCGGTHVSNTGDIGAFKIISESSVSAGTRRIIAITGTNVWNYYKEQENQLKEATAFLKAKDGEVLDKIAQLFQQLKEQKSEIESLKSQIAASKGSNLDDKIKEIGSIKYLIGREDGLDMDDLAKLGDQCKDKMKDGFVLLFSAKDDKVSMVAMATPSVVEAGIHSGNVIKEIAPILGGGGGGRPNMARAGGKDASKIDEAMKKAEDMIQGIFA